MPSGSRNQVLGILTKTSQARTSQWTDDRLNDAVCSSGSRYPWLIYYSSNIRHGDEKKQFCKTCINLYTLFQEKDRPLVRVFKDSHVWVVGTWFVIAWPTKGSLGCWCGVTSIVSSSIHQPKEKRVILSVLASEQNALICFRFVLCHIPPSTCVESWRATLTTADGYKYFVFY